MALIAIDMTPVLPGGENGGVRLLALELIKGFQATSPDNRFLILTASWNHEELAPLDSPNTERICMISAQDREEPERQRSESLSIEEMLVKVYGLLPRRIREKLAECGLFQITGGLRQIYGYLRMLGRRTQHSAGPLSAKGVKALFCPFAAPTFAEPDIPVVSVVCDLQHREYPQFFSSREIGTREGFFHEVKTRADAIICISEASRQAVIRHLKTNPERTFSVPICIQSRLVELDAAAVSRHLTHLRIDKRPYMFYPANYWPHKNHHMLIAAFGMFLSRNPGNDVDLVLTGALDTAQQSLKDKVRRMGLEERVHFLGYLPEEQLMAIWRGCSLLIFPSLYEGFGIPVLEAMQFGKPVLCSDVTSLPEVAGDAALYFDPRKPHEIVQCLERIMGDQELYNNLVKLGYQNLSRFKTSDMVNRYLQYIEGVIDNGN